MIAFTRGFTYALKIAGSILMLPVYLLYILCCLIILFRHEIFNRW